MATTLYVYGPIEIPVDTSDSTKFIDGDQKKEFLRALVDEGLAEKQGCYVFALRAAKGYKPWYVGKATKTMKQECMGTHQLHHYNAVLKKGTKGTPVMFFVMRDGNKKKVAKKICDEIESALIQAAFFKNPQIRNVQKAKAPEWGIDGVMRGKKGKPKANATSFRKMLGL